MNKTLNIVSVNNDRVKQWSRLLDKKGRDQQGKFLVEGTHLVMEAIRSRAPIESIVYAEFRGIPQEITEVLAASHIEPSRFEWISVSEEVLTKCTDAQTPQGVFAVVNKQVTSLEVLWGGGLGDGGSSFSPAVLVVVVDGVQDPGNLGTIIRGADAVGATAVIIGRGTVDLYNPKTVRSTMGSMFHLPIIETDLEQLLQEA
ncbi:MAG: methyltransferase, TrmH family, partial [Paenibacillus sp.]|nr:methyltransferase, TrmH family [Paenibacillus sp.]